MHEKQLTPRLKHWEAGRLLAHCQSIRFIQSSSIEQTTRLNTPAFRAALAILHLEKPQAKNGSCQ
jgi:hypothetical protein